jgi:damage-control phosphatase, subfamily III
VETVVCIHLCCPFLIQIEMCEISLWGNATDLSVLTNLRSEDVAQLQGKQAIEAMQENIVVNDMAQASEYVDNLRDAQIDIILDNAGNLSSWLILTTGFELFVDVFFAAYFVETGIAKTVVCHPKDFGWFVSDVTPADFESLFNLLQDAPIAETQKQRDDLKFLIDRWKMFYDSGKIRLRRDPFWTTAHPFSRMPTYAPELFRALQSSDLVIYKGCLNYRKLVGDVISASTRLIIGVVAKNNKICRCDWSNGTRQWN